jgi:hypothetical protein
MAKPKTRTLADFRAAHDPDVVIPNKLRSGIAAMLKSGKEHWEYEADFLKLAGVTFPQLAAYRGLFDAHIVQVADGSRSAKRVWFADPKVAKKQRGE